MKEGTYIVLTGILTIKYVLNNVCCSYFKNVFYLCGFAVRDIEMHSFTAFRHSRQNFIWGNEKMLGCTHYNLIQNGGFRW